MCNKQGSSYSNGSSVRSSAVSSSATSYAAAASNSSIGYAAHNALKNETYGNSLIHQVSYNNRLQPIEIKLGTSGSPASIVDIDYSYGTTTNNGTINSIDYSGGGLSYTQAFTYDSLNRLKTANENSGSAWSQTNDYDRYGNRRVDLGGGTYNLAFSSTTNRITTSGYSYDSSGNLIDDTVHDYTFDPENKIQKGRYGDCLSLRRGGAAGQETCWREHKVHLRRGRIACEGRFTSVDPIMIHADRLNDPQTLNLYSYVRNSPLNLTDKTGMDFLFDGIDEDENAKRINQRKNAQFKTKLDKNNILQVVDQNKVDPSKLSASEKKLFDAITDKNHRATITGVGKQDFDFGSFGGESEQAGHELH